MAYCALSMQLKRPTSFACVRCKISTEQAKIKDMPIISIVQDTAYISKFKYSMSEQCVQFIDSYYFSRIASVYSTVYA